MLAKSGLYKHRVVPGHMGGTYEEANVVLLTIQQHALAHKKLYKTYGKHEDYLAWKALSGQINKKALTKELELLRRRHISEGSKGHGTSLETRRKIADALRGRSLSLQHRAKLSAARMGKTPWNKGKEFSSESRAKMRAAKLGTTWSASRRLAYEKSKEAK